MKSFARACILVEGPNENMVSMFYQNWRNSMIQTDSYFLQWKTKDSVLSINMQSL